MNAEPESYRSPPHVQVRVLWRLVLPSGSEVTALFIPHEQWVAVSIKRDGEMCAVRDFDNREAALRWAETQRLRLLGEWTLQRRR